MNENEEVKLHRLYQLDWIKILDRAIKNRPLSWYEPAVREWRNASDEILFSLMLELKENNPAYWVAPNEKDEKENIKNHGDR
jgi:hypothetical protein